LYLSGRGGTCVCSSTVVLVRLAYLCRRVCGVRCEGESWSGGSS
jgi:hypothetical protein